MIKEKSEKQRVTSILVFSLIFLFGLSAALQGQIKRKHLYKFRDNNRFEGIKTKKWKPVSGTLELSSFMIVDKNWLAANDAAQNDSLTIHFYSPVAGNIKPSIYYRKIKYFMNPKAEQFKKGWNAFSWSAAILNEVKIPLSKLNGVVEAKKGNSKVWAPISFQKPSEASKRATAQITLVPDKDMVLDVVLVSQKSGKAIKTWSDLSVKSDAPHIIDLPKEVLSGKVSDYSIIATEKSKAGALFDVIRKHTFHIAMFKN